MKRSSEIEGCRSSRRPRWLFVYTIDVQLRPVDASSTLGRLELVIRLPLYYPHPAFGLPCPWHRDACRQASIQEQARLCILHHPLQPLLQVHSRHGTAGHNVPFVCLDGVESQSLYAAVSIGPPTRLNIFLSPHPPRESRLPSWTPAHRSCF